jgi:hypothetical protein
MERTARLAGKIVEADFYVRQITVLEICIELSFGSPGAMERMRDLGIGRNHVNDVAETIMSRLLDDARRDKWAELAEPDRPPPLEPEQMIDKGDYKLLRQECFTGPDLEEQRRAKQAEYEAAAKAQVEWEEKARLEAAEWRERLEEGCEPQAEARRDGDDGDDGGDGDSHD